MSSDWKWRLYFFVRVADNTVASRQTFAAIFANNGSGESAENEGKLFNAVTRLSVTGVEPAQVLGINVAVKSSMRDALEAFVGTLAQNRYYAVLNVDTPTGFEGKLLKTNDAIAPIVQPGTPPWDTTPFTWQDALDDLLADRGLQVIQGEAV